MMWHLLVFTLEALAPPTEQCGIHPSADDLPAIYDFTT